MLHDIAGFSVLAVNVRGLPIREVKPYCTGCRF